MAQKGTLWRSPDCVASGHPVIDASKASDHTAMITEFTQTPASSIHSYLAADGITEVGAVRRMGIAFAQFIDEVSTHAACQSPHYL